MRARWDQLLLTFYLVQYSDHWRCAATSFSFLLFSIEESRWSIEHDPWGGPVIVEAWLHMTVQRIINHLIQMNFKLNRSFLILFWSLADLLRLKLFTVLNKIIRSRFWSHYILIYNRYCICIYYILRLGLIGFTSWWCQFIEYVVFK